MIYQCTLDTPLGAATASAADNALTGFWFIGQKYYPANTQHWIEKPDYPVFAALRVWLDAYFAGKNPTLDLPLNPKGTAFQEAVWKILLQIPHGKLSTYGDIAKQMAKQRGLSSMSSQAVGGAVGHNPISVLIPCHRVIGSTGSLTGYAGGIDKKIALLHLEGANMNGQLI